MTEVSIITTSFMKGKYILECMKSVAAQRRPGIIIHHLIVDAGSTDDTLKIFNVNQFSHQIVYFVNEGQSQTTSLNFLMDKVNERYPKTEFIGWINADDWYEDNWLEASLKNIGTDDMTCTQYYLRDESGKNLGPQYPDGGFPNYLDLPSLCRNSIAQMTVFIRKTGFDNLKKIYGFYFNPAFEYTQDYELWVRMVKWKFRIRRIRAPLANLRHYPLQMSVTHHDQQAAEVQRVLEMLK